MIEVVVTCDRCGKKGGDGKGVSIGLSIANPAGLHICSRCADAFHSWCAKEKAALKAAAKEMAA